MARRFEALEGRRIVGRSVLEPNNGHYLYAVPGTSAEPAAPHSTLFVSERFASVIPVEGSRRVLLQHDHGLLVVE